MTGPVKEAVEEVAAAESHAAVLSVTAGLNLTDGRSARLHLPRHYLRRRSLPLLQKMIPVAPAAAPFVDGSIRLVELRETAVAIHLTPGSLPFLIRVEATQN